MYIAILNAFSSNEDVSFFVILKLLVFLKIKKRVDPKPQHLYYNRNEKLSIIQLCG